MTKVDREKAAIAAAVTRAVVRLGIAGIRKGEFFGMKQGSKDNLSKAA